MCVVLTEPLNKITYDVETKDFFVVYDLDQQATKFSCLLYPVNKQSPIDYTI